MEGQGPVYRLVVEVEATEAILTLPLPSADHNLEDMIILLSSGIRFFFHQCVKSGVAGLLGGGTGWWYWPLVVGGGTGQWYWEVVVAGGTGRWY